MIMVKPEIYDKYGFGGFGQGFSQGLSQMLKQQIAQKLWEKQLQERQQAQLETYRRQLEIQDIFTKKKREDEQARLAAEYNEAMQKNPKNPYQYILTHYPNDAIYFQGLNTLKTQAFNRDLTKFKTNLTALKYFIPAESTEGQILGQVGDSSLVDLQSIISNPDANRAIQGSLTYVRNQYKQAVESKDPDRIKMWRFAYQTGLNTLKLGKKLGLWGDDMIDAYTVKLKKPPKPKPGEGKGKGDNSLAKEIAEKNGFGQGEEKTTKKPVKKPKANIVSPWLQTHGNTGAGANIGTTSGNVSPWLGSQRNVNTRTRKKIAQPTVGNAYTSQLFNILGWQW